MNNLLYLFDLFNFYYLFNNLLYCDYFWHFYDPINYLLYDFLNLDYLGADSEYFEDIINVDSVYNLGLDHSYDSFINLKGNSCFDLYLLELFQKGLQENS